MIMNAKFGARGVLYCDGVRVPRAYWADTDLGIFEAFAVDANGDIVRSGDNRPIRYRGQGKLEFKGTVLSSVPVAEPEICVEINRTKPLGLCEYASCMKPAKYFTSDETPLKPAYGVFERAAAVYRHRWCEWHYKNPKLVVGADTVKEYEVKVRPD